MRLRDSYDIPEEVVRAPHSTAFADFLWNWFGDTYRLTHGELDLTFLNDLTPDELTLARELVRRNLKLRQNHIIEGVSALHDVEAAPILRAMLDDEPDLSRQLTIAGALWKLIKDPIFVELLYRAKSSGGRLLTGAHLLQVLWLDSERAIDFLIDLLDQKDVNKARRWPILGAYFNSFRKKTVTSGVDALGQLNWLETGVRVPRDQWRPASYYRSRRNDPAFREQMTAAVQRWNADMKNSR